MKQGISLLMAAALLLCVGCAHRGETPELGYDLYFRERDLEQAVGEDALRAEQVLLETAADTPEELAEQLMLAMLNGPSDPTLINTIPAGTSLQSVEYVSGQAIVDLSPSYRLLSDVNLMLADYAITMTLCQIPKITSVKITVSGRDLSYRDKQVFLKQDLLLSSKEDVVGTVDVKLYFINRAGVLASERRTLSLYEGDTQVAAVMKALRGKPENTAWRSAIPENFEIGSVWMEEETCYVNLLSERLPEVPDAEQLELLLQAAERSLSTLESVKEVRFLVDGELTNYYGSVYIGTMYVN